MLLGRRAESIAVAESVVEGVTPTPAIIRVMPLSWTATIITSVSFCCRLRGVGYRRGLAQPRSRCQAGVQLAPAFNLAFLRVLDGEGDGISCLRAAAFASSRRHEEHRVQRTSFPLLLYFWDRHVRFRPRLHFPARRSVRMCVTLSPPLLG